MKTEQEQIEEMTKDEIKKALECCEKYAYCKDCPCSAYCTHDLHNNALALITKQEKEIERLKAETSNIRKETAKEILDMLCDIGIDNEILECCRIYDVNGVSLAKQICEKYGVEIEK